MMLKNMETFNIRVSDCRLDRNTSGAKRKILDEVPDHLKLAGDIIN